MTGDKIKIRCLEVRQPIGTFLIGAIATSDLVAISFADVRRPEGRDIEKYIGTQRDLSEGRVVEIKKYVAMVDACFPTMSFSQFRHQMQSSMKPKGSYRSDETITWQKLSTVSIESRAWRTIPAHRFSSTQPSSWTWNWKIRRWSLRR